MIRFQCEHCGHKISVQDKHAGKRVKCPKCGSVVTVPVKSTIVDFHCDSCGRKISAPRVHAGKKGRCPKCNNIIIIPAAGSTETAASQAGSKYSDYDQSLLDIQELNIIQHQQISQYEALEQANGFEQGPEEKSRAEEFIEQRKLPWPIDIFLYPTSVPGLKNLAIFIGVPLLIDILGKILPIQLSCLFALVTIVVNILLFFYIYWYFTECVRDSADGGLRAPEGLGATPGVVGMFLQTVNVIGCLAIFFAPFVFYMYLARRADIIFWLLLIFAVFLYPMGLLAVVLFDSALGLNPRLLFKSISNTFFPYCGLVLQFLTSIVLISMVHIQVEDSPLWEFIFRSVGIYIILVAAHILGRFYWRYQDKLNWDLQAEK